MKNVRAKIHIATAKTPRTKLDANNRMLVGDRVVSVNSSSQA
jgi:hypothetical protein